MVVAVTGGIGSGKSRVARLLASRCQAMLIDLDLECRHLLQPGQPGTLALQEAFGPRFVDSQGCVDRPALRQALFSDATLRAQVDGILHPLARQVLLHKITAHDGPLLIVEIPLLFEVGWQDEVDVVVVVWSSEAVRLERVVKRDRVSRSQAEAAIRSQMPLETKVDQADHVVDNDGPWADTTQAVDQLADSLFTRCLQ